MIEGAKGLRSGAPRKYSLEAGRSAIEVAAVRLFEEQIIASGMASGEFSMGDATLAARLVNTACIRFRDPRLIVEHEQEPEPTLDQMISFCLAAIGKQG